LIKRIISLQSIPLIFLPVTVALIGFALWSMYVHQNEMELLVTERNFQEVRVGIELLNDHAETLQSLDQAKFQQFVDQKLKLLNNPDTEQAFIIVDQNKKVLFYNGGTHRTNNLVNHAGVAEALAGNTGSITQEFSNIIHLISYGPIEPLGWAFVIEETWEGGRLSWLNLTFLVPLLLIPLILIFFIYMWGGNRWVLRPLSVLNRYAQRVGDGQYDERLPFVSGIEEINVLHHHLERMVNKLRESRSFLRSYASAIQTGQEEERKRLSQELHDDTIQSLVHLDQQVQLMDISTQSTLVLRTQIAKISSNLRSMIQDLRPSYLDELGLVPAIDMLTKSLNTNQPESVIVFDVIGKPQRLPSEVELVFYRVAQEGISNSLKHANSETIFVTLSFLRESTQLEIQDEGCGIADGVLEQLESSFGLRGMHERAFSIDGKLELVSDAKGTMVSLIKNI
jgi:signal transduction histidine kinase